MCASYSYAYKNQTKYKQNTFSIKCTFVVVFVVGAASASLSSDSDCDIETSDDASVLSSLLVFLSVLLQIPWAKDSTCSDKSFSACLLNVPPLAVKVENIIEI